MADFKVQHHVLVPKHEKLSEKEVQELYQTYKVTFLQTPKITKNDAAIAHLSVKTGDIIKITRASRTAGEIVYYRGVIDG